MKALLSFVAGEGSSFDMEMASEVERGQFTEQRSTVKQDRCRRVKREGTKKGKKKKGCKSKYVCSWNSLHLPAWEIRRRRSEEAR